MILSELLYKLVLFCDIVRVGKNSYCEFDKFEVGGDNIMNNPWKDISLSDYERHMALDSVQQLQAMNQMMKGQLNQYYIQSAMILGVAGGNGLEHVDTEKLNKVYGVDINQEYLLITKKRYENLYLSWRRICKIKLLVKAA